MEQHQTVSLLDLVALLLRRRWIVVGVTLAVILVALGVLFGGKLLPPTSPWNLLPDQFTPTVKVLLQESTSSGGLSEMLRSSGLSGLAGINVASKRSNAELARDLLQTTTLLDTVVNELGIIERYGITESPRTNSRRVITQRVSADFKETSGIMTLGYTDIDREFATRAVTRIVALLAAEFRRLTLDQVSLKRQYLETSVASVTLKADRATRAMLAFQASYGVLDVATQASEVSRAVSSLQTQLTAKQLELKVQERYLPASDPRIVTLKGEIEEMKSLMTGVREGSPDLTSGAISQQELPELQLRYATLKRDVEAQQQILAALKQQLEVTQLEELNTAGTFQIVETAEVPERKSRPRRALIAVFSAVAGGLLGVFTALVVDRFARAGTDPDDAARMEEIRRLIGRKPRRRRGISAG